MVYFGYENVYSKKEWHIMTTTTTIQRVATGDVVSVASGGVFVPVAGTYLDGFKNELTRDTMAGALDVAAQHLGELAGYDDDGQPVYNATHRDAIAWHELSPARYAYVRNKVAKKYSPSTTNKAMVAVRGCARLAWLDGVIPHDVYARVLVATEAVKVHRNATHGRIITNDTYRAVIDATPATTPAGVRNVAILHMMRGAGLRRDEVAGMTRGSYDVERGAVHIVGKGAKPRTVYLPPVARVALDAWVSLRDGVASGGAMFVRINKAGVVSCHGMTAQAIYNVVIERMATVGATIRPHDLRRTYATHEARRGVPLPVLQRQLGHASLATTSIYMMHDDDEQQRHAAGLVL
jgi:integrase